MCSSVSLGAWGTQCGTHRPALLHLLAEAITVPSCGRREGSNGSPRCLLPSAAALRGTEGTVTGVLETEGNAQGGVSCRCNNGNPQEF